MCFDFCCVNVITKVYVANLVGCWSVLFYPYYVHYPLFCASVLLRYWENELECKKSGHQPRLLVALVKCLWWRLLLHGLMYSVEVSMCNVCVCVCVCVCVSLPILCSLQIYNKHLLHIYICECHVNILVPAL